jgi:hypothetical protein
MTNLLEQAIAVVNYYSANMADRSSSSATGCRPMRGILPDERALACWISAAQAISDDPQASLEPYPIGRMYRLKPSLADTFWTSGLGLAGHDELRHRDVRNYESARL